MNKTVSPYRPMRTSADLSGRAVRVRRNAPPPDLADYVYEFWQYDVDPGEDFVPIQVFPSGCISLRFNLRPDGTESVLYGPCLSNAMKGLFFSDWIIFGAALYPDRAYHLLGIAVQELRDLRIHMDCLWPNRLGPVESELREAATFEARIAVFSRFLRQILRRDIAPHDDFLFAFREITRAAPSAADLGLVARRCGTNGRSLRRHFARYLGLGPKQMDRVIRVQRCMRALTRQPVPLAVLAADHGFSDQAHLSREFKRLVGLSPRRYASLVGRIHDKQLDLWSGLDPAWRYRPSPRLMRFR